MSRPDTRQRLSLLSSLLITSAAIISLGTAGDRRKLNAREYANLKKEVAYSAGAYIATIWPQCSQMAIDVEAAATALKHQWTVGNIGRDFVTQTYNDNYQFKKGKLQPEKKPQLRVALSRVVAAENVSLLMTPRRETYRWQSFKVMFRVDVAEIENGLRDGKAKRVSVDYNELTRLCDAYYKEIRRRKEEEIDLRLGNTLKASQQFMAANAGKPGVISLKSGVQYKVIKLGKGSVPKKWDIVECKYTLSLGDGRILAKTEKKDPGVALSLRTNPLKGLRVALRAMPVGSRARVYIPPHLALGDRHGRMWFGDRYVSGIPPCAVFILRVKLIKAGLKPEDVKRPPPAPPDY